MSSKIISVDLFLNTRVTLPMVVIKKIQIILCHIIDYCLFCQL